MVIIFWITSTGWRDKPACRTGDKIMIEVNNNIAKIEGTPKQLCKEFTHLIVQLINTFESEFSLSQEDCINIINECAKIAYMTDEERADKLKQLEED